jgi:hypothetical protein
MGAEPFRAPAEEPAAVVDDLCATFRELRGRAAHAPRAIR